MQPSAPPCASVARRRPAAANRRRGRKSEAESAAAASVFRGETDSLRGGRAAPAARGAGGAASAPPSGRDSGALGRATPAATARSSRDRRSLTQQHRAPRAGGRRQIAGTSLDKLIREPREPDGFLPVGIHAEPGP